MASKVTVLICRVRRRTAGGEFCFCVRSRGAPLTGRKSPPMAAGLGAFSAYVSRAFPMKLARNTAANFAFFQSDVRAAKVAKLSPPAGVNGVRSPLAFTVGTLANRRSLRGGRVGQGGQATFRPTRALSSRFDRRGAPLLRSRRSYCADGPRACSSKFSKSDWSSWQARSPYNENIHLYTNAMGGRYQGSRKNGTRIFAD